MNITRAKLQKVTTIDEQRAPNVYTAEKHLCWKSTFFYWSIRLHI